MLFILSTFAIANNTWLKLTRLTGQPPVVCCYSVGLIMSKLATSVIGSQWHQSTGDRVGLLKANLWRLWWLTAAEYEGLVSTVKANSSAISYIYRVCTVIVYRRHNNNSNSNAMFNDVLKLHHLLSNLIFITI